MLMRGEIPEARLVGHVRQCHRRDWPSCRHHKASSKTVFWFVCPWLDYCGLVYPFSSRVRFPVGAPNQNTVTVRARIDTAKGPAWAAPEKHRGSTFQVNKKKPELAGVWGGSGRLAAHRTVTIVVMLGAFWADARD